ncbi:transposase [Natrinema pallidum DSM 3751]|uniref:Transposase n=1 Tax=Natrinema pallidum DSM 3751 TaxID=1227495 RepID=L9YUV6_9EURY|nr:transposase [Natrinema pallidum DSM 3751]
MTLLARTAVDHLETQTSVTRAFVDSLGKTTGGVLRSVLEALPCGPDKVAQTLPTTGIRRELRKAITGKTIHDVEDAVFLVDGAQHLQTALRRHGLRFRYEEHGNRNAVERIFREIACVYPHRVPG